jgi:hypothetical protein
MAEEKSTRDCEHCRQPFVIPRHRQEQRYCSNRCSASSRNPTMEERLWARVDRSAGPSGCWPWTGPHLRGYGQFSVENRTVRTHRMAWQATHGNIADGMCVLHRCDNPPCCNPSHLFLGTNAENTADKIRKGRARYLHGEDNPMARLSAADVMAIRSAEGPQTAIGARFGICQTSVSQIKLGKRWKGLLPSDPSQNPKNL